VDEFKDVNGLWMPYLFWVEDTAAGTPAAQTLMSEIPSFPIQLEPATQGGKRSRAHAISLYIRDGRVRFPRDTDWFEDADYFLTHYPNTSFDDDIDALYQLVFNLQHERHPSMYEQGNRPKQTLRMR
jgi:phage terminase large subunit-like protein